MVIVLFSSTLKTMSIVTPNIFLVITEEPFLYIIFHDGSRGHITHNGRPFVPDLGEIVKW